jgi:hypothetical protein
MTDTASAGAPSAEELRTRIAEHWDALSAMVCDLPEETLSRADENGWAIRDYLAHLAGWERSLIGLLDGRSRLEAMDITVVDDDHDTDAINARLLDQSRRLTPSMVLQTFAETHQQLMTLLAGLSDEDMPRPYSHFQPGDLPYNHQPVWGWIVGNTIGHYEEHRPAIARLARTAG